MNKHFDIGSLVVIAVTFVLFLVALFTKGMTHDLLLESAVLLVSIKLIMMAYKTSIYYKSIQEELQKITELLNKGR